MSASYQPTATAPATARQSASTPRIRPRRAARTPPARPSVHSAFRRAPTASTSASAPSAAATGIPYAASMRSTRFDSFVNATAAGSTSTPSSAKKTDANARPLLLDVWTANGSRWDRTTDDADDGDQRQQVRERLEQVAVRLPPDMLEAELERRREAEQERGGEGAERAPVPEDERGEADEPSAGRDVLRERV